MTGNPVEQGPFAEEVRAVAADLGVPAKQVVPAPAQGQVNVTVFLGDELVLRIPRKARAAELLAKEAEVVPLVRAAGVPTPELVRYDASLRVAPVPYVVLERVHGATLAERERELDPAGRRRALGSLGEILATLHRIRRGEAGEAGAAGAASAIPEPYAFSPEEVLGRLREAGEIGGAQHAWLLERFDALRPGGPSIADPVLVHRDVAPSNLITDGSGRVTTLLDWGLAQWGSPARDLVGLPLRALPDLLSGYGAPDAAPSLERDALWYHLYLALARLLKEPSTSEDRNWAAPRAATLIDLLAFLSGPESAPWPSRLRAAPAN